jgi:hypothetical protein
MGIELERIVRFTHGHVDGRFGGFVAALRRPSVPVQGITEGRCIELVGHHAMAVEGVC